MGETQVIEYQWQGRGTEWVSDDVERSVDLGA